MRVARKHISWYSKGLVGGAAFRNSVNRVETVAEQLALTRAFFDRQIELAAPAHPAPAALAHPGTSRMAA